MTKYSISQLMRANFPAMLGLRTSRIVNTASERNDAVTEILRTEGGATLSSFFVAPQKQSTNSRFSRRFSNSGTRSLPSMVNQSI